jgi:hypothetical protein
VVLPTCAHVAVAYRPYGSSLQTIKIYPFNQEHDAISIQIFHEQEKQGAVRLMVFSPSEPKFMVFLSLLSVSCWQNLTVSCSSWTPSRTRPWRKVTSHSRILTSSASVLTTVISFVLAGGPQFGSSRSKNILSNPWIK